MKESETEGVPVGGGRGRVRVSIKMEKKREKEKITRMMSTLPSGATLVSQAAHTSHHTGTDTPAKSTLLTKKVVNTQT